MNFLNWFMPSYEDQKRGVIEVDKKDVEDIEPKLTYYYVKGKPLSYLEVDQNTKYFKVRLDILDRKLDRILEEINSES